MEWVADRPDHRVLIAVDRADGVILRLEESMGGVVTRDAMVTAYEPNVPLSPSALAFTFPADTTFISSPRAGVCARADASGPTWHSC